MPSLVSVIIPSYNHGAFIEQAVLSVLRQSYRHIELLVLDDGSKDQSVAKVKTLFDQEPTDRKSSLHIFTHANKGASATINDGLRRAQGDYLTILNSDDFFAPTRIETFIEHLKSLSHKPTLAISAVQQVDEKGGQLEDSDPLRAWYMRCLQSVERLGSVSLAACKHNIAMTSGNLFFSRSLFEKVGEFGPYRTIHDYDYFLRSLFVTEPIYLNEKLISYRHHGKNTFDKSKVLMAKELWLMANSFFQKVQADKRSENPDAPWAACRVKEFQKFLQSEESVLTAILGRIPSIH